MPPLPIESDGACGEGYRARPPPVNKIEPRPRLIIPGATARADVRAPATQMRKSSTRASGERSSTGPGRQRAALYINTSGSPILTIAASMAAVKEASSPASAGKPSARKPRPEKSAAAAWSLPPSRAMSPNGWPSKANADATPAPTPGPYPIIIADPDTDIALLSSGRIGAGAADQAARPGHDSNRFEPGTAIGR